MPVPIFASLSTCCVLIGCSIFFALYVVFVAVIDHDLSIAFASAPFALGLSFDFEDIINA